MAEPEIKTGEPTDPVVALMKKASALLEGSGAPAASLLEVNSLIETLQKFEESNGARQERKEIRQFWLAAVGGILFVAFVFALIAMSSEADKPKRIEQVLTAFLAAVPSAIAAYFFGQKTAKKD